MSDSSPPNQLLTELIGTIEAEQPSSIVYCTREPVPALDALRSSRCRVEHARTEAELKALARFDLGVVFDCLEHQSVQEGQQLVGRLRNLHCAKVWVAVPSSEHWNLNAFIGLGFRRLRCHTNAGREVCSYSYDIDHYNHKREWNTPKYWANPQNWGKYWW